MSGYSKTDEVLDLVHNERQRQEALREAGRFKSTCSDPAMSGYEKCAVLTEEVGEVSEHAGDEIDRRLVAVLALLMGRVAHSTKSTEGRTINRPRTAEDLKKELIQVAAVAVAWAESL